MLETSLNKEQVMVRAIRILMIVTGNLANWRDGLVGLLLGLLSSLLFLRQKDLVTREVNEEEGTVTWGSG